MPLPVKLGLDQNDKLPRIRYRVVRLTRTFYRLLKFGAAYVEQGQTSYEERYKERLLHNLTKRAKEFGFQLTPLELATVSVS